MPAPPSVEQVSARVGFWAVLQQTPLAVTVDPPSLLT